MSSSPPAGVPVTGADPTSFARSVLAVRHPALIEQVRAAHPYGPRQRAALDRLAEEIAGGPIQEPPAHWPDHAQWRAWGAGRWGRSWFEVPFLWAESYFYRRLLDAVDHDGEGPYRGLDPFEPAKSAELVDVDEPDALAGLAALAGSTDPHDLLLACVWGNRADLGFRAGAAAQGRTGPLHTDLPEPLLVDDGDRVRQRLDAARRVVLVADNAGRELLADLLLIDHLLRTDPERRVELHVKPAPYFVSDATGADVSACLRVLARAGAAAADAARRLHRAAADGSLRVSAHPLYCAPSDYRRLPADLHETFRAADLVLMKGDLNYRRLVGDELRPVTTPFAAVTDHFPGPVAALRTLKSDVVVGLDAATEASLEATGQPWRTSGTQALIQLRD